MNISDAQEHLTDMSELTFHCIKVVGETLPDIRFTTSSSGINVEQIKEHYMNKLLIFQYQKDLRKILRLTNMEV